MAEIVLGLATSHGPLLTTPPDQWMHRAEADKVNPTLYLRGHRYDFGELAELRAGGGFDQEITDAKKQERYAACQRAIGSLAATLAEVNPDVLVVIGNDQDEVFGRENIPAFLIYSGETIDNAPPPPDQRHTLSPGVAIASSARFPETTLTHPAAPLLANHVAGYLIEHDFDVSRSELLPPGVFGNRGAPHAFGFVYRRLLFDVVPPHVPVFVNTDYPPNRPTLARCFDFGTAIADAIRSWPEEGRVAVVASGGLSHFVIDEALDRDVLAAIQCKDRAALASMPLEFFESATSEWRCWVALAGAMSRTPLAMDLVDYVPCYRSLAGTGNAMGFARWC